MPHKRVEKRTLERVDEDIARAKASIQRIQTLSAFGQDAKKQFTEFLNDLVDAAGQQRDSIQIKLGLGQVGPDVAHAITWASAQQNAYKNVLDILSEPEKVIGYYRSDLENFESERKQYEQYEQPR